MQILTSTATFLFSAVDNIESQKEKIKELVHQEFPNFRFISIPDEMPLEIPRFIARSHHGFSSISISPKMLQFTTNFNKDFSSNWKGKCEAYITDKTNYLFPCINYLSSNILYCGLTTRIQANASSSLLLKKYIQKKIISNISLNTINVQESYVFEDTLFLNIQFQNNVRDNSSPLDIIVDVNDRYSANTIPLYKSNFNVFKRIKEISSNILENKLIDLINKGDFTL